MSKRAEQKALEAYPEQDMYSAMLDGSNRLKREVYIEAYEQAEKDTIEGAVAWLKEHANDYIVDLTPTYPDAPYDIIIGGKCWEDLKEYMENE